MNSEFYFSSTSCLTKAEEPSLPYYLPIAGGRIIGFIPFPRVLVLCGMQSVLSRNRTRIAVSISCDDNHYTTGTSTQLYSFKYLFQFDDNEYSIALNYFGCPRGVVAYVINEFKRQIHEYVHLWTTANGNGINSLISSLNYRLKLLATVVEGDQKVPFSIATTPRRGGGRYSFSWIAPLYSCYVPYIARRYQVPF